MLLIRFFCVLCFVCSRWQDWLGFSASAVVAPPSRVLCINQEMLELGVCLPASTTRRLLVLQSAADVALEFAWDLGVFEEERAVISGRLSITPASGETWISVFVLFCKSCMVM